MRLKPCFAHRPIVLVQIVEVGVAAVHTPLFLVEADNNLIDMVGVLRLAPHQRCWDPQKHRRGLLAWNGYRHIVRGQTGRLNGQRQNQKLRIYYGRKKRGKMRLKVRYCAANSELFPSFLTGSRLLIGRIKGVCR